MKQESLEKIQDYLCIGLNYLLFVAAAITVLDLFQADSPKILLWTGLIAVPILIYRITKKPQQLMNPVLFMVLLTALSMLENTVWTKDWSSYYIVIAFIYLIGYFGYFFISKFLTFWLFNRSTASNIPTNAIFRNGMGQTVLFTLCSSVFLFFGAKLDWVKVIAEGIWALVLELLRFIFSGIKTTPEEEGASPPMEPEPERGDALTGEVVPENIQYMLRNLILAVFFMALVLGVILLAYYAYYVITDLEWFKGRKKAKAKLVENDDVREYCGVEKKTTKATGFFVFRTNRDKIRRIYYKKVVKHKKELVGEKEELMLGYLTAKQCCDKLSEQQLKLIYEKARYSEAHITAEDVKSVK